MDFYTSTGELYHHGIKGQQWGVKNGPPYPLSDEQLKKMGEYQQKQVDRISKKKGLDKLDKEAEQAWKDAHSTQAFKEYEKMIDSNNKVYGDAWDYATKKVTEYYGGDENIPDEFEDFKAQPLSNQYFEEYMKSNPAPYTNEEISKQFTKAFEKSDAKEKEYEKLRDEIIDEANELVEKKFGVSVKDL